jgi:2-keto-4-pentenoate hydratase/2-oxohepta-3-ene-1,7-dioic acid hydratase in catechol pathway
MKWIRYNNKNIVCYGILQDNIITEVKGSPFESYEMTETTLFLSDVQLLIPVIPKTFYAAGTNYEEHIKKVAELIGTTPNLPIKADIGYRANNALIPHNEPVIIPSDATEQVQYEAELVVVIGKTAKNISEEDALDYVLGYTIGNDVSERSWQKTDKTLWRAKNTDTFKPMGPWIETDANIENMITQVKLNGEITIEFKTNNMIFGVEKYISEITKYLTLHPGDVIWMGTDGEGKNMSDGDICEISITGIGKLSNPIFKQNK